MRETVHDRTHYEHAAAPLCALDGGPLKGLRHRTVIDGRTGAVSLALWQEEHLPGFVVPLHLHDCEEIITVISGEIEAAIGDESLRVGPLESILIPARAPHGFRVAGREPIRLLAIFSSPRPRIFRADGTETTPPWEGGRTDHLSLESS